MVSELVPGFNGQRGAVTNDQARTLNVQRSTLTSGMLLVGCLGGRMEPLPQTTELWVMLQAYSSQWLR